MEIDFSSMIAAYKQEAYCKHKGKCLHKKNWDVKNRSLAVKVFHEFVNNYKFWHIITTGNYHVQPNFIDRDANSIFSPLMMKPWKSIRKME